MQWFEHTARKRTPKSLLPRLQKKWRCHCRRSRGPAASNASPLPARVHLEHLFCTLDKQGKKIIHIDTSVHQTLPVQTAGLHNMDTLCSVKFISIQPQCTMDLAPCISGMQGKVSCTMFCSDPLLPNEHQESIWGHVQTASLFAIGSGQAETTNPLRVSQSQHHLSMAVLSRWAQ